MSARTLPAALAALLAAAGCGVRSTPPAPEAVVNRVQEVSLPAAQLQVERDRGASLRAEIDAPSGARIVTRAFARGDALAFRFRPLEAGRHAWRVVAGGRTLERELARGSVTAQDLGVPGQVSVRGGALAGPDGRPFRPLGENRFNVYDPAWSGGLSIEAYVARMAADGMNTLRVFIPAACGRPGAEPRPGCLEPALGRFDEGAARTYDAILDAAERHGVKVILSVFAIGFTPGDAWKGWEDDPYSAARGGPARTPEDFFRDPGVREAARRRLRYVLARWAASPALLSVDLLNEPEWDGGIPEDAWIPWAEDLARTWREEDPYGHPVTAGPVGLHWNVRTDERGWWASGACDVVQWHRYGPDVHDVHALARALVDTVRDTARYGKPVLVGEFAWGGEPAPLHDHTHVGIWAATFAGAGVLAHSAPPFTIDSDEPMTPARSRHFRTLALFLRRAEAREPLAPAADPRPSLPGARALALGGASTRAIWVLAPREGYGAPVAGLRLAVAGLAPGRWRVSWVDDVTGLGQVRDAGVVGPGGAATLEAPPFTRHVAALLERVGAPGEVQARAAPAVAQRATPAR